MNATNPENATVIAATPGLDRPAVRVVVTVPTFRRPDWLLATLRSVAAQVTRHVFAVIVIENDAEGREGASAARPLIESGEVPGLVLIAHDRGNCSAYNAGWSEAFVSFPDFTHILVIDDDETADPDWLERMMDTAAQLGADAVGGPQLPVFEDGDQARWADHPVFRPPFAQTGPVAALYSSGNLLIARPVLERLGSPYLDVAFNFLGGGDSDFLSRAAAAGFTLAWCAEGRVREIVPARRTTRGWIRARAVRNGVISTLVEQRRRHREPLGRLKTVARSLALAAASPLRAAVRLVQTRSPAIAAYPVEVAAGRILAEFGYKREQYREPEKN